MDTSVAWINDYLDRPLTADEQADLLTHAGFPLEGRTDLDGDIRQDFEMTSNRGDCTCHLGLARELSAVSDRKLSLPEAEVARSGPAADSFVEIENREPEACPRYTAQVITDAEVKPSPEHIASRLTARGDIPRSNIVDATNFVLFEFGQPTHVFDLDKIAGGKVIIRRAESGERFLPIGEDAEEITLAGGELVIADAEKPIALAGVKGGALTAVTDSTRNLLIEAATFDPVAVRETSRKHNIASDSSFRFERGVSPGQIEQAAQRLCHLILRTAGGTLAPGTLCDGAPMPEQRTVSMRTQRCRDLLGLDIDDMQMVNWLDALGFEPTLEQGEIVTTVPWHRGDIEREVDLIEEVMRMHGFASVPVETTVNIAPVHNSHAQRTAQQLTRRLIAEGFVETVTHSLISDDAAAPFLAPDTQSRRVIEARAAGVPALRPSIMPGLMRVRKHNADHGVGPLRLFEMGQVFFKTPDGVDAERLELGLLMDVTDEQQGIGPMRGVINRLATALAGSHAVVKVTESDTPTWLSPAGHIEIDGHAIGWIGRIAPDVSAAAGLEGHLLAATLDLTEAMHRAPAAHTALALPDQPAIERDVSLILSEEVSWNHIESLVNTASLPHLEALEHVTTWRGRGVPDQHKSVTLRMRFRAADHTLTHAEVDAPLEQLMDAFKNQLGAEIRA